jgi:hypothetical protein
MIEFIDEESHNEAVLNSDLYHYNVADFILGGNRIKRHFEFRKYKGYFYCEHIHPDYNKYFRVDDRKDFDLIADIGIEEVLLLQERQRKLEMLNRD